MKLLKKNPDGTLEVLQTEHPITGSLHAFAEAKGAGDGEYIADFLDGSYLPFQIVNGEPQGGVTVDETMYGKPYETTAEGGHHRDHNANSFYNMVPDVVGQEEAPGNAWDDYIPTSQRA